MSRLSLLLAAFLALALVPTAAAEFGPETEDGWPISVDGKVIRPPVAPVVLADLPDGPVNKVGPFTAYPYYPILTAEVQRLAMEHPDLVKLTSAGKSTAGLDVWLLEIADFENPDMIPLEEREVLYIDGGTHSNEYSGVYFVTEIAQFLLDEYATNETAKWIVENRHTWILPMVNPDGSNAFGRLNAKAVNVNRNFPTTWGTVEEQPVLNNPGPEPASEVETRIVMGVIEATKPDYVNSIHCCGNLWLHPWGAEQLESAADMQMFTRICDEAFAEVREDCGEIWSTIYPASGTTADEGYGLVGASSWSYEMSGRGAIVGPWGEPAVNTDVREQERESWGGILHAFLNVEKYGARPVLVGLEGEADRLVAVVENQGYGNVTVGNLTIGGARVALPPIAAGARAEIPIDGAFAAGTTEVVIDWQKRAFRSPTDVVTLPVDLVEQGGRLVATAIDGATLTPASEKAGLGIPAPAIGLVALGVAIAAAARRRA